MFKTRCYINLRSFLLPFIVFLPTCVLSAENVSSNNIGRILLKDSNSIDKNVLSSVYASKDTYGMRSNAVVAAFSANPEKPFDFPILGFSGVMQMAKYKDRDSVSLYADNTALPFKSWERVKSANYTATSFTTEESTALNLKPGMLVETGHEPSWSSYIISIVGNKVITSGWVNNSTGHLGIPKDGSGLVVNPITKIWATNFNIFFPEGGRANKGVIQENGLINNNIDNPSTISGLDTVVLPQSKFGGTAAYLARSADSGGKQQWTYGFLSSGSKISFLSSDSGIHYPEISFHDSSSANNGLVFDGKNKSNSILWKDGNNNITAKIDPTGRISMIGYKTREIKDSSKLTTDFSRYIVENNSEINLILPDSKNIIDGFTLKIVKVGGESSIVNIRTPDNVSINGEMKVLSLSGRWNKEVIYYNKQWFFY
ncbi:hypothetical protein NPQ29_02190 [Raoultella planticola]|uniref:hypothetical protein n=1 Tax=Raoultella planticola TaxID=575 RepID=UPI002112C8AB|nr:hypothetical protein [Raoultella planticola]MCQ6498736.1 hypothetical protein [Raoultella planticola]